jgi:hypothetical protein
MKTVELNGKARKTLPNNCANILEQYGTATGQGRSVLDMTSNWQSDSAIRAEGQHLMLMPMVMFIAYCPDPLAVLEWGRRKKRLPMTGTVMFGQPGELSYMSLAWGWVMAVNRLEIEGKWDRAEKLLIAANTLPKLGYRFSDAEINKTSRLASSVDGGDPVDIGMLMANLCKQSLEMRAQEERVILANIEFDNLRSIKSLSRARV